jgi:hypothetical protein
MTVWPAMMTPPKNSANTSTPSSRCSSCAASVAVKRRPSVRLTALLLVPRLGTPGVSARRHAQQNLLEYACRQRIARSPGGHRRQDGFLPRAAAHPRPATWTRRPPNVNSVAVRSQPYDSSTEKLDRH